MYLVGLSWPSRSKGIATAEAAAAAVAAVAAVAASAGASEAPRASSSGAVREESSSGIESGGGATNRQNTAVNPCKYRIRDRDSVGVETQE